MNNNKYRLFIINLVLMKTKLVNKKNTGKKHVPIYIKFSKIKGEEVKKVDDIACTNMPIDMINKQTKSKIKNLCN